MYSKGLSQLGYMNLKERSPLYYWVLLNSQVIHEKHHSLWIKPWCLWFISEFLLHYGLFIKTLISIRAGVSYLAMTPPKNFISSLICLFSILQKVIVLQGTSINNLSDRIKMHTYLHNQQLHIHTFYQYSILNVPDIIFRCTQLLFITKITTKLKLLKYYITRIFISKNHYSLLELSALAS